MRSKSLLISSTFSMFPMRLIENVMIRQERMNEWNNECRRNIYMFEIWKDFDWVLDLDLHRQREISLNHYLILLQKSAQLSVLCICHLRIWILWLRWCWMMFFSWCINHLFLFRFLLWCLLVLSLSSFTVVLFPLLFLHIITSISRRFDFLFDWNFS